MPPIILASFPSDAPKVPQSYALPCAPIFLWVSDHITNPKVPPRFQELQVPVRPLGLVVARSSEPAYRDVDDGILGITTPNY